MLPTLRCRSVLLATFLLAGTLALSETAVASPLELDSLGDFGFLVPDETDWMFNPALLADEDQGWVLVETDSRYNPGSTVTYDLSGTAVSGSGSDTWSVTISPSVVLPLASGSLGISALLEPARTFDLDATDSSIDLGLRAGYGVRLSPRLAVGGSLQYAMLREGERPAGGEATLTYVSQAVRPWVGVVYQPETWTPVEISLNPVFFWGEDYSVLTGEVTSTYSEPYVLARLRTAYPEAEGYKLWLTGEHVQYVHTRQDPSGTPTSEVRYRWDAAGLTAEWARTRGRLLAGAELYNWARTTETLGVTSLGSTGLTLRTGASVELTSTLELRAGVMTDFYYQSEASRPSPDSEPTSTSSEFAADADPYLGLGWQVSDWTVDIVFPMDASNNIRGESTENRLLGETTVNRFGDVALTIGARRSL